MKMFRTWLFVFIIAMVLHDITYGSPPSSKDQQKKTTATSSSASSPGASSSSDAKAKLTKLEKAEEQVDTELKKEEALRKNATGTLTPNPSSSSSYDTTVTSDEEDLCNNALHVDFDIPGSVTLCTCGLDQVLVNGTCQNHKERLTIQAEKHIIFTEENPVGNYKVRVQDLVCNSGAIHRNMTFEKGMFYLRNRGDIVLTDAAGELVGLRINEYCVDYFLNDEGKVSSSMKACIPHPIVPRCCPENKVMVNGTCITGPSPGHLYPPITADPRGGDHITWPIVKNQVHTLKCGASEAIRSVTLDINGSYMLALANGLAYRWYSTGKMGRSEFKFCPDFCVDGKQGVDGSVEYYANFCQVQKKIEPVCKKDSCIRKCCKPGEIMSVDHYRCMRSKEDKFMPPVTKNLSNYEVIVNRPNCAIHLADITDTVINEKGVWQFDAFSLEPKRYCMDTFAMKGTRKTMALMCPGSSTITLWMHLRRIMFPVCQVISLIFLGITVLFHIMAPVLVKQEGWHRLAYVLALMLAYASTFSLNVYHDKIRRNGCVEMALLMQFGFISTFFWLTVMCFDIERKIRSLRHFRAYIPFHPLVYAAFGLGGPLFISLITLIMHATVPYNSSSLISPAIGLSRCWFHGDQQLLIYFYGPVSILFVCNIGLIISTAYNYVKIERGALGIAMKSANENGPQPSIEYERQKQTKRNFGDFKHTFLLLAIVCFCWVTEVLSWRIQPAEIWAFTDLLNSLQGLFIFILFLSNRRNRKILKHKHPRLYSVFQPVKNLFRKIKGFFVRKTKTYSNSAEDGIAREPSISSEFSELSENNCKPAEPTTS